MNTKLLLPGAAVAAFAVTNMSAGPLLSPQAAGNQIKVVKSVAATPAVAVATVAAVPATTTAQLPPRAQGNLIKAVKSGNNDVNPALACQKTMGGTPKMVAECTSHTTMPGCAMVALGK